MQLQKTNASDKDKLKKNYPEKQNIADPKENIKAPNNRPNTAPSSKNLLIGHLQIMQRKQEEQIGMTVQNLKL